MSNSVKRRSFVGALLAWTGLGVVGRVWGEEDKPAFEPGEKLRYSLGWQFITAGYATTQVLEDGELDGKPVNKFEMTAQTRPSVDKIFKVRDKLTSYTEKDMSRALRFEKDQHEGKTQRDVVVDFDWDQNKAFYENRTSGGKRETELLPGCQDPLSAFYFVRQQKMDVGTVIKGPLTDGKRTKEAEIRVVKREQKKVNGKKYNCLKLVPDMKDVGGVFEKSKDANITIWVTDDHRHIPVLMKSKVVVGSFVCEIRDHV